MKNRRLSKVTVSHSLLTFIGLVTMQISPVLAQSNLENGIEFTGEIDIATKSEEWIISADKGNRLILLVAETSGGANFSPKIEVFDTTGRIAGVDSGPVAARLDLQAAESGNYRVVISDQNNSGAGTYKIQLAQPPTPFAVSDGDQGGIMTDGSAHQGVISLGDLDRWTLPATKGDRFVLQLVETSGAAQFKPSLEVFSPSGRKIGQSSDTLATRLNFQAETTGDYSVIVSDTDKSGFGEYSLVLAQLPLAGMTPPSDEGGPLVNGHANNGNITLGDLDQWTVTATKGERLILQLVETAGGPSFSPQLELIDPMGRLSMIDSDTLLARLDFQASVDGDYTVLVSGKNASDIGSYSLYLAQIPENFTVPPGDEGGSIDPESPATGSIPIGDLDIWSFDAARGDFLSLQLDETAGAAVFNPQLELFSPTGRLLDFDTNSLTVSLNHAVDETGTYHVVVSNSISLGSGDYLLSLSKNNFADVEGSPLTNGSRHLGEISVPEEIDRWKFVANVGESFVVRAGDGNTASLVDPLVQVFGPDGNLIDSDSGPKAAVISFQANLAGTYLVTISDSSLGSVADGGRDTGSYAIHLAKTSGSLSISPGDEGGELINGFSHVAALDTGDLDVWRFSANQGDSFVVRAGDGQTASEVDPLVRVYNPDGSLIDDSSGSRAAVVNDLASQSGIYTVVIFDSSLGSVTDGGGDAGSYAIHLAKTSGSLSISPGDEGGELLNGFSHVAALDTGDLDVWRFSANQGDSFVVRAGDGQTASEVDPLVWVYNPDGSFIDNSSGSRAAVVNGLASQSGIYTVVIFDSSLGSVTDGGGDAGSYAIHLAKTSGALSISPGDEGGELLNGFSHVAALDTGDLDVWRFSANQGDSFVVRAGDGQTASEVDPLVRVYNPDGSFIDDSSGSRAAVVNGSASQSGIYTVVIFDSSLGSVTDGGGDAGSYAIHLAKTSGALSISPGDEGGELLNGFSHVAALDTGDLDVWRFSANQGDSFVVRAGDGQTASEVDPLVWVYHPDGSFIDGSSGSRATEISSQASQRGIYTVVVFDSSLGSVTDGGGDMGSYSLNLALAPERFTVGIGDNGGPLPAFGNTIGEIFAGDLDTWGFFAQEGNEVNFTLSGTSGDLVPWLRVYDPDGMEVINRSRAPEVAINLAINKSGAYQIIISDGSSSRGGAGGYTLSASGLPAQDQPLRLVLDQSEAGPVLKFDWFSFDQELILQENESLEPTLWRNTDTPVTTNGLNASADIPASGSRNFFRVVPASN